MKTMLTIAFSVVAVALLMCLSGCEEPFMYDMSSGGYKMMSTDPSHSAKQRQAAALMSVVMRNEAQRVHERNLANGAR